MVAAEDWGLLNVVLRGLSDDTRAQSVQFRLARPSCDGDHRSSVSEAFEKMPIETSATLPKPHKTSRFACLTALMLDVRD
jgi:hypothetical protein